MIRRAAPIIVTCLAAGLAAGLTAPRALANPWPRGTGDGFAAASIGWEEVGGATGALAALYGEYGWSKRLTFSAGIETRAAGGEPLRWELGARWFISEVAPGTPVSAGLGVVRGHATASADDTLRLRAAVHVGRGIATRFGDGWVRTSLSVLPALDGGRVHAETYTQAGLRPTAGTLVMLSLATYHDGSRDFIKLSPAAGLELRHRGRRIGTVVLEATREFGNDRDRRLVLSMWRDF